MKKFSLKDIFIVSLVIIIAIMFVIRGCSKNPEVGNSEQIVDVITEQNVELVQEVKDSLALLPLYRFRIDSLQQLFVAEQKKHQKINKEYEKLISDIDNYTVTDDIQFFLDYLSSRQNDFGQGTDTDNAGTTETHE